jgi:hypothetical protein
MAKSSAICSLPKMSYTTAQHQSRACVTATTQWNKNAKTLETIAGIAREKSFHWEIWLAGGHNGGDAFTILLVDTSPVCTGLLVLERHKHEFQHVLGHVAAHSK